MPRNPLKSLGRRTSSVNNIDTVAKDAEVSPVKSSFRVLDRPEKTIVKTSTADSTRRPGDQTFIAPVHNHKRRSADELVVDLNRSARRTLQYCSSCVADSRRLSDQSMKSNPDSRANYDSSVRHSSASTIPSSVDIENDFEEQDRFDAKPQMTIEIRPLPDLSDDSSLPSAPPFATRAAIPLSFGTPSKGSEDDPSSGLLDFESNVPASVSSSPNLHHPLNSFLPPPPPVHGVHRTVRLNSMIYSFVTN